MINFIRRLFGRHGPTWNRGATRGPGYPVIDESAKPDNGFRVMSPIEREANLDKLRRGLAPVSRVARLVALSRKYAELNAAKENRGPLHSTWVGEGTMRHLHFEIEAQAKVMGADELRQAIRIMHDPFGEYRVAHDPLEAPDV